MGTSLTTGQASLLRRFTRRVVLAYDSDNAGRNATLRAAPILLSAGLHVEALDLQGEKDPDSLIQKHGTDKFLDVLSHAIDIFEFGIREWAFDAAQLSGREKSGRVEQFMPILSAVTDPVVRNEAAQRIADVFRLEFETVWSRVRGKTSTSASAEREKTAPQSTGEKFVLIAALQGKLTGDQVGRLTEGWFEDPACKTVFSIIRNDLGSGRPIDFGEVATHLRGEAELTLLSELSLTEDLDDQQLQRLDENLAPMERAYLDRRQIQIQRDLQEALRNGDEARADQLAVEKQDLARMLRSLK
jgi:DNA primase